MGTTRTALKNRIDRLAQRMGCCPTHGAKLRCVHEFEWLGTDEQLFEAAALAEKKGPGVVHLQFTGLTCPSCGSPVWCEQCVSPPASPGAGPLLTPEETARYLELSALMREKSPDQSTPALPEPPAAPVPTPPPEPPSLPAPVAPVAAPEPVVPIAAPAPVTDDEDEVDAELADLVKEALQPQRAENLR
jgi:hypothetical protein